MRNKNIRKNIIYISVIVIAVFILYMLLSIIAPKPPVSDVIRARESIAETRIYKAQHYVPMKYLMVLSLYDSLISEWERQNQIFNLKRDFSRMKGMTEKIIHLSDELKKNSKIRMMNLEELLENDLANLKARIDIYDTLFKTIPLSKPMIEKYTRGRMLFIESKSAYDSNEHTLAYNKLLQASDLCNEVIEITNQQLSSYFDNYPNWAQLTSDAVNWSRKKKQSVLIVDKFAKSCYLYISGRLKDTYEIELGPNWIGSKRYKGDNATPEGKYLVTKKIRGNETKYYKALLLNYPNEEDKKRFNEEIKSGSLPKDSDIGGFIEIHGEGGKGFHWTNGCIALANINMDSVFKVVSIGTPVIVVGSLKKLSDLFNLE